MARDVRCDDCDNDSFLAAKELNWDVEEGNELYLYCTQCATRKEMELA